MKIIDESGAAIENPDLTLGYLADGTEPLVHPAREAVEELSHYETVAEYPNGGKDVQKIIDREGSPAQEEWTEQVAIQRYIRYTEAELAQQKADEEAARKHQEALDTLPETLAALQSAQTDTDTLMVDQEYRMTLLELGVTPEE